MDTFMDKLAEKINAQEMIRANTSAELEELGQVKDQIRELKDCVDRMEAVARENPGKAPVEISGDSDVLYILEDEVNQLGGTLSQVKDAVAEMNGSLSEVKETISGRDGGAQTVTDGGIGEVKEAVAEVASGLSDAKEAVAEVAASLSDVKGAVTGVNDNFYGVKDSVAGLGGSLEEIREEMSGMNASCLGVSASLAEVTGDVSEMKGAVADIVGGISEMKQGIGDFGSDVKGLREGMDLLREEFAQAREESKNSQEENPAGTVSVSPSFQDFKETVEHFLDDFSQCKQVFYRHKDELTELSEGFETLQELVAEIQKTQAADENLLQELRKDMDIFAERLTTVSEASATKTEETMDALKHFLVDRLSRQKPEPEKAPQASLEEQRALLEEHKTYIDNKLTGMHESLREGYHKECVKVYRNVQAAMMEELEKQTAHLQQDVEKLQGKFSGSMIFSVLAFVAALAGVVLQVLNILNIL